MVALGVFYLHSAFKKRILAFTKAVLFLRTRVVIADVAQQAVRSFKAVHREA